MLRERAAANRDNGGEAEMMNRHLGMSPPILPRRTSSVPSQERVGRSSAKDVIGTEWREHLEERGGTVSRSLLRFVMVAAAARRAGGCFGQDSYDHVEANLHWDTFRFLGTLLPTVYVLRGDV
jgi:hypothetical protein